MKNTISFILCFLIISFFGGCKKDSESVSLSSKTFGGSVQKGPFQIGTSITVNELDLNFAQTGKSFSSQITDNLGSFQINSIPLVSDYIAIRANGYYFNEVCGSNSSSQITLDGISNIDEISSVHLNILTHLEKLRVEYLLGTGLSFDLAKATAQSEVLTIFNVSDSDIPNSEQLDISESGDGNAILLAVSAIIQGFRSESELSSLLTSISVDISTDGVLNDNAIKSSLIDHAILLDTVSIRENIVDYYTSLGVTPSIPDFEPHIQNFINNTAFTLTNSLFQYPPTGTHGDNLLYKDQLNYTGSSFTMKAVLKECTHFKVRIQVLSGLYSYLGSTASNWIITPFSNQEQFFTIIDHSLPTDLRISGYGTFLIEYYELDSSTITFSKTITVN